MPAQQGVTRWPREGHNLVALVDENDLPLPDRSVDRVLLVHAVECTEQVRPMLREIWRVMADGGRLVAVAPTRAGLWSQIDRSPFYHGQPYSSSQLNTLLRANMFTPINEARALFLPPVRSRLMLAELLINEGNIRGTPPRFQDGALVQLDAIAPLVQPDDPNLTALRLKAADRAKDDKQFAAMWQRMPENTADSRT